MKNHRPLPAIAKVAKLARQGEPLWPYLSKETEKEKFQDALLNHWGIVHFHLGDGVDRRGYVERGGPLLFAWIADTEIYFLRVDAHRFANDDLLNIIVGNWAHLLEPFRIDSAGVTSAVPPEFRDDSPMKRSTRTVLVQRAPAMPEGPTTALRDAGVSPTFVSKEGVHFSAPGGGVSCAGTGNYARVLADYELLWANEIAKNIEAGIRQIVDQIEMQRGIQVGTLEFKLESLDALRTASVLEVNTRTRCHLRMPTEFDYDFNPTRAFAPLVAAVLASG